MSNFEAKPTLAVAAARALSGAGTTTNPTVLDVDTSVDWLSVQINLTAIGGTAPNYTFSVQWSIDGTTWADADTADSFTALTAVGDVIKRFTVKGPYARIKEVATGTLPTATYTANAYQR